MVLYWSPWEDIRKYSNFKACKYMEFFFSWILPTSNQRPSG